VAEERLASSCEYTEGLKTAWRAGVIRYWGGCSHLAQSAPLILASIDGQAGERDCIGSVLSVRFCMALRCFRFTRMCFSFVVDTGPGIRTRYFI
jgi:hypothetical protein